MLNGEAMEHAIAADDLWYERLSKAILAVQCPDGIDGFFGDPARIAAGVRVYRNNVRSAYGRALGDIFPVVKRLVGEAFFKGAAAAYFDARRPRARLIARYGDAFPQFLEKFPPAQTLPYLAEVARLELLWLAAYHAPDAAPLSAADALARADGAAETLRLSMHPSLQLYASRRGGFSVWAHEKFENKERLELGGAPEFALIVRPEAQVRVAPVSQAVHDCVAALAAGALLGEALETALAADAAAEPGKILQTIFEAGAVCDAAPGEGS